MDGVDTPYTVPTTIAPMVLKTPYWHRMSTQWWKKAWTCSPPPETIPVTKVSNGMYGMDHTMIGARRGVQGSSLLTCRRGDLPLESWSGAAIHIYVYVSKLIKTDAVEIAMLEWNFKLKNDAGFPNCKASIEVLCTSGVSIQWKVVSQRTEMS